MERRRREGLRATRYQQRPGASAHLEDVAIGVLQPPRAVHLAILDGAGVHGGRAPSTLSKANVNDRPRSNRSIGPIIGGSIRGGRARIADATPGHAGHLRPGGLAPGLGRRQRITCVITPKIQVPCCPPPYM